MAKFCAECGAQLEDDAQFCGSCGAPVKESQQFCGACGAPVEPDAAFCGACGTPLQQPAAEAGKAADEEPAAAEAAAGAAEAGAEPPVENGEQAGARAPGQEPAGAAAAVAAPPKKPLPKWALPVGIAVAAVVVLVVAASLILKSLHSPERTMERFLDALSEGNFQALSDVAAPADDRVEFTEETTAPLFALYESSVKFRKDLESILDDSVERMEDGDDPDEDQLVWMQPEKAFLHTRYTVMIETCDSVELGSNLACEVTLPGGEIVTLTSSDGDPANSDCLAYGPDYGLAAWSYGTAYDLLPGLYTVEATVETSFGETFEAETTLEVAGLYDVYGELYFEYSTIDIYNDSSVEADIYIDGTYYATAPSNGELYIAPILPETQLEARANVETDEPMTETFSADEGYYELHFVLCELEVNNGYDAPITVYRDGEELGTVEPYGYSYFSGLPMGTEVELQLFDESVTEPVFYVCEYEYDYIYPDFTLTDTAGTEAKAVVESFIQENLDRYNTGDLAGLQERSGNDFVEYLAEELESVQSLSLEENGYVTESQIILEDSLVDYSTYVSVVDGALVVEVYYDIPLQFQVTYTYDDGNTESSESSQTVYYAFILQYEDGAWVVETEE